MENSNKQYLALGTLMLAISSINSVSAKNNWSIGAGAMAERSAYKAYKTKVIAMPLVLYNGQHAFIEGTKAGVFLYKNPQHQISINVEASFLEFDASESKNSSLKLLDDRKLTLMGGVGYQYTSPFGDIRLDFLMDTLGRNKGAIGHLEYMYPIQVEQLRIELAAGLGWQSNKFNNYYYGISAKEALRSGLKRYTAGSSFTPDLSVRTFYSFNNSWQAFAFGSVGLLGSDAKDSPMTARSYNGTAGLGFLYAF